LHDTASKVFHIAWTVVTTICVYQHVHSTVQCYPKSESPKITTTTNGEMTKPMPQKDRKQMVIKITAEMKLQHQSENFHDQTMSQ
jgi:hypothetical protein